MLLDNPNSVPMDAAWDDDDWWNLAATRDRHEHSSVLTAIHNQWAAPRFGDDAEILLRLAEIERDAPPVPSHEPHPQEVQETPKAPEQASEEHPPAPAPTARRPLIPGWATYPLGGAAGLALVAVVAAVPNYDLKTAAGLALIILVLALVTTTHRRGGHQ
ncbi:hypothetical protein, partial [Streptosporangium sp. NPDC051022]|uniref:hypothetical protein n=1 Tax=Streptosporangium sp. NPDC051022 TaxID=3155752 RepID=UPI0034322351